MTKSRKAPNTWVSLEVYFEARILRGDFGRPGDDAEEVEELFVKRDPAQTGVARAKPSRAPRPGTTARPPLSDERLAA